MERNTSIQNADLCRMISTSVDKPIRGVSCAVLNIVVWSV